MQGTVHRVQRKELPQGRMLVCPLGAPGRLARAAAHRAPSALVPRCWPHMEVSITPKGMWNVFRVTKAPQVLPARRQGLLTLCFLTHASGSLENPD